MKKNIMFAFLLMVGGATSAFLYLNYDGVSKKIHAQESDFCSHHKIPEKNCPWCDPSLIKKMGTCAEHNVPEALCSQCNPLLISGFKVEGDWCAGHNIPESQCKICKNGQHSQCGK